MVVAGTIGYRTASGGRLMNYDEFFADAIAPRYHIRVWHERATGVIPPGQKE